MVRYSSKFAFGGASFNHWFIHLAHLMLKTLELLGELLILVKPFQYCLVGRDVQGVKHIDPICSYMRSC